MISNIAKIGVVSIIHILLLFSIAPIIDHAFTPLHKNESNEEILHQLERITNNYQIFQNLITTPSINEIAHKYLAVIKEANSFAELN